MALFRTPLSDLFGISLPNMANRRCRDFQLNFTECLEIYGYPHGGQKCKDQLDDFMECAYGRKQMERVGAMKRERLMQVLRGERSWRDYFAPIPPLDSFDEVYGPNT